MFPPRRSLIAALLIALVAVAAGCDSASEDGTTIFLGTVVDATTDDPVAGATVNVVGTGQTTATDTAGRFSLEAQADSTGDAVMLEVFASGYDPVRFEALAVVGQEVPVPDLVIRSRSAGDDGDSGGGGDDGDPGGFDDGADGPSGPAASITLVERSSEAIGVAGVGADETATLTFVVLDGLGNPVDTEHAVDLTFEIGNGPGGGEFLTPTTARTDANGKVQATLSSGTVSGTVQLVASMTVDGETIRSQPVVITITGGLPDDDHFSVRMGTRNLAEQDGGMGTVTAIVGDKYGNPVQPGTAVYFTTDGGVVEGSGVTDDLGMTTVRLIVAEPIPSNADLCPGADPTGYGTVTARTADEDNVTVEKMTNFLFSDEIITAEILTPGLELGAFDFTVSDRFGHPLAAGTRIEVDADGINVEAIGDVDVTLGDNLCPGPGKTEFRFSVVEGDEIGEDDLPLPPSIETITITINGPNGSLQLTRTNLGGRGVRDTVEEDPARFTR